MNFLIENALLIYPIVVTAFILLFVTLSFCDLKKQKK
jgi:hypothetical protein